MLNLLWLWFKTEQNNHQLNLKKIYSTFTFKVPRIHTHHHIPHTSVTASDHKHFFCTLVSPCYVGWASKLRLVLKHRQIHKYLS